MESKREWKRGRDCRAEYDNQCECGMASLYDFCLFIYVDIYYESWKLMPLQLKWVINMQPKPSANWKLNRKGEKYLNFVMCFRN